MIKLEVKDYCHDCVGFEAEVESPTVFYANGSIIEIIRTDTIVRCKHRDRCAYVVKYVKENENDS